MGILVSTENFEHEITEEGELLFLDYDLAYDETMAALGGEKSPALKYLEKWDKDPIPRFLTLLGKFSREQAVLIARTWLGVIVEISGVKKIDTTDIWEFVKKIDKAIMVQDGVMLGYLNNEAGVFASECQQRRWLMSPPHGSSFDRRTSPKLAVAHALISYIHVGLGTRCVYSFWYDHGGLYHAFRILTELTNNSISDLSDNKSQDWVPWNVPIPADQIPAFRKYLVGQAVTALLKDKSSKP